MKLVFRFVSLAVWACAPAAAASSASPKGGLRRRHPGAGGSFLARMFAVEAPWERRKRVSDRGSALHPHFARRSRYDASLGFAQDLLAATNFARRRAGLHELSWDAELATAASEHAASLCGGPENFQHSSLTARHPDGVADLSPGQYVGENIYKVVGFDPTGTDVVDAWYTEIEHYTFGEVGKACTREKCEMNMLADAASGRGGAGAAANMNAGGNMLGACMTGHFTQLLWSNSATVGCGKAACGGTEGGFGVSCRYFPGGNIVGTEPFSGDAAFLLGLQAAAC